MTTFADILNGMGAEERLALIDSAQDFLTHRGDYDTCVFCKQSLTNLVCDANIGFECSGYMEPVEKTLFTKVACEGYRYTDRHSTMFTCDMPVCESCRTQGNPVFFNGGEDTGFLCGGGNTEQIGGSGVFFPDLCPIHSTKGFLCGDQHPVITKDEAVAWRQQTLMLISAGMAEKVKPYPVIAKDARPTESIERKLP